MVRNASSHMVLKSLNVTQMNKWPIRLNHVSLTGKNVPVLMVQGVISNTKPINHRLLSLIADIGKLSIKSEHHHLVDYLLSSPNTESF